MHTRRRQIFEAASEHDGDSQCENLKHRWDKVSNPYFLWCTQGAHASTRFGTCCYTPPPPPRGPPLLEVIRYEALVKRQHEDHGKSAHKLEGARSFGNDSQSIFKTEDKQ